MTLRLAKNFSMAFALSTALIACASTGEPPTALLNEAQSDIKAADQVGAEDYAPLALRSARKHIDDAKAAIKKEEYEMATLSLQKSMADIDYAVAKTEAEKSQNAAKEIEKNLDALRKETL